MSITLMLACVKNLFHAMPHRNRCRPILEILEDRIVPAAAFAEFVDPDPALGNDFGATVVPLSTGNVVITSPGDNAGGTDAGAVYLFNGATGALISTLIGSEANDNIGNGVVALSNGNYVVDSYSWSGAMGAVTFGNGTTGISGTVSASNSLVGSTAGDQSDQVGSGGVTPLSNGNYVVDSPYWTNGAAASAGAVTFGSGITGISGVVNADNSLVGSTAGDGVGGIGNTNTIRGGGTYVSFANGVVALNNGNYVVDSPSWTNGAAASAGAVTFGSGTTGISGVVSADNSLVGSTAGDEVGGFDNTASGVLSTGVVALSNGNYVVDSFNWNNGAATNAGAVTFGSGTTGISGTVSAKNSLVGTTAGDEVGGFTTYFYGLGNGVVALSNGNYVVESNKWSGVGAVTFASGTTGISGAVSASNSLVGTNENTYDDTGAVTPLSNGNYVVDSYTWNNGAANHAGAVTFGSGTTGITGAISASNSLVGTTAGDEVGVCPGASYFGVTALSYGVTALSNGNYLVTSPFWSNGAATYAGAVTFASGTSGISGAISASNSLLGSTYNDNVGFNGVTALSNGNYVVDSPYWNNSNGAVTFGNGTTGISGAVSASNSLVGSGVSEDRVGLGGVTALSNGNYVVNSYAWCLPESIWIVGAVTFGSGVTGISGAVSASNSLVGSSTYTSNQDEQLAGPVEVIALSNGNYLVDGSKWYNGVDDSEMGAVTFGNGTTGISGTVSASNSLVGSTAGDEVGYGGVTVLTNGNYLVDSYNWNGGLGAMTFGSGSTGISGAVSASNSLVGVGVGFGLGVGVMALSNGNYVVDSPHWNNGAATDAGAVTFGNGTTGVSGAISASNSLVGSTANDEVGFGSAYSYNGWLGNGLVALSNGNYVVYSPDWNNGAATQAGAVTFGSGATGISGVVSAANSMVGLTANTNLQPVVVDNVNGNYFGPFNGEDNGKVRVGSQTTGIAPTVTGVSPATGSSAGGASVVITGTGFTGATAVEFGSTNATSFTVNSYTQVTATSPPGAGVVDVTIDNPVGGTSATSSADQFTYVPQPSITSVVINQDIASLNSGPTGSAQRSMVDDIVYTFSEPVSIPTAGADPNVFTIAVASGWTGTVPTLSWAAVTGSNDTEWAVTFSGNGVTGGSIANGAYTITVTDPASITAQSDDQALTFATNGFGSATQSFYRLFGDINGDGVVNAADNLQFKQGLMTYNAAFDFNDDGVVNAADNLQFKNDLSVNFTDFTATI